MTKKYRDVIYDDKNLKIINIEVIKSKAFNVYNNLLENKDEHLLDLINQWIDETDFFEFFLTNNTGFLYPSSYKKQGALFESFFSIIIPNFRNYTDIDEIWKCFCVCQHSINSQANKLQGLLRKLTVQLVTRIFHIDNMEPRIRNIFISNESGLSLSNIENKEKRNRFTNFPLGSKVNEIIPVTVVSSGKKNVFQYPANIIINTNQSFINNLMREFFNDPISALYSTSESARNFFSLFGDSLKGLTINKFSDFSEQTFLHQFNFYQEKVKSGTFVLHNHSANPSKLLFKFYTFLDKRHQVLFGKQLFDTVTFNRNLFRSSHYRKSFSEGAVRVVISGYEDIPTADKWFVFFPKTKPSYKTHSNFFIELDKVNNQYFKEDLKYFFWNYGVQSVFESSSYLIDFLNELDAYNQSIVNLSSNPPTISSEFLLQYYSAICEGEIKTQKNREYKTSTKNSKINSIRNFINFYKQKYSIPELIISSFSEIPDVKINNGIYIPEKEILSILDEFNEQCKTPDKELFKIILLLSLSTKLRIGEILSLRRDCIIEKNEKLGTIKYYPKSTNDNLVYSSFSIEIINLIEKAIVISSSAVISSDSTFKDLIFVYHPLKSSLDFDYDELISLYDGYKRFFYMIMKKLYKENKISMIYSPNHCRHTFINKAYELVDNHEISFLDIPIITGNSTKVAKKNYLNRQKETNEYLNAIEGIELFKDKKSDIKNNEISFPILNGLGNCNSEECIKIDFINDTMIDCLTCQFFVTSVEKLSIFEKNIKNFEARLPFAVGEDEAYLYKLITLNKGYVAKLSTKLGNKNESE
ncbi:tyrosine-type recombinase/integrase [Streptococcus uberis]|uniref:tyrosine-type recombinase/integrase n=1 Tax=Streptococcus uberis TaxID=1349 RepID=UPI000E07A85E|nr:site-specific integrase [Streptococcus uberis]SUO88975.1 Phage integrase family [Streptococcus uberis]